MSAVERTDSGVAPVVRPPQVNGRARELRFVPRISPYCAGAIMSDDKKQDDANTADNAERHREAAPPTVGKDVKPQINAAGTPEVVPGPPRDTRPSPDAGSRE